MTLSWGILSTARIRLAAELDARRVVDPRARGRQARALREAADAANFIAQPAYQLQLENMTDAIRGEAEPLLGRSDALGQARAIELLYRSAAA